MPQYTATEYTRGQMDGKPHRVGWHKFATRKLAERWAERRLATPMMAPHWVCIKAYRSRTAATIYEGDGDGNFKRLVFNITRG